MPCTCVLTSTVGYRKTLSSMENFHIMIEMAKNAQTMLENQHYAFPSGLCFSRLILLKLCQYIVSMPGGTAHANKILSCHPTPEKS